jgi:hypothetical protein
VHQGFPIRYKRMLLPLLLLASLQFKILNLLRGESRNSNQVLLRVLSDSSVRTVQRRKFYFIGSSLRGPLHEIIIGLQEQTVSGK